VIVDAKDEAAKRFYEHFEFVPLPDTPRRLFLPMRTIEKLVQRMIGSTRKTHRSRLRGMAVTVEMHNYRRSGTAGGGRFRG